MSRLSPITTLLAILLLAAHGRASASGSTGNVNLLVGTKINDYWADGSQSSVGLDLTCGSRGSPIQFNAYGNVSWGKGRNAFDDHVSEASYETGIGFTKIWNARAFHPHLGAGLAYAIRKSHIVGVESGDIMYERAGARPWIAVGGFWHLRSGVNVGVAMRRSELRNTYPSLGGTHIGFTLGWGWL